MSSWVCTKQSLHRIIGETWIEHRRPLCISNWLLGLFRKNVLKKVDKSKSPCHNNKKSQKVWLFSKQLSKEKMKKLILATVAVLGFAPSALAGTGVMNSTTIRHSTGHGKLEFNSYENYNKVQQNTSESIKVETFSGDQNTSIATYKNGKLSGTAISTNNVPIDPVAIITVANQSETVNIAGGTVLSGFEKYNFTETTNTLKAESYSF